MPDFETLLVIAFALLPGYIAAQAFVRNSPYVQPTDLQFVLQLASWSAIVHATAAPVTIPILEVVRRDPNLLGVGTDFWVVAVTTFVVFLLVIPMALGLIAGGMARTRTSQRALGRVGMSLTDQAPTAWDAVFWPGRAGSFVRVSLRDYKDPIAGRLGTNSVVGISPHAHDLYLEQLWIASKRGWKPVEGSLGVWLSPAQIDVIEFFGPTD